MIAASGNKWQLHKDGGFYFLRFFSVRKIKGAKKPCMMQIPLGHYLGKQIQVHYQNEVEAIYKYIEEERNAS